MSSTSLSDSCQSPTAVGFGTVQPGTPALTATGTQVCRLTFGSSNDTSRLQVRQADRLGTAMAAQRTGSSETRYVDRPNNGIDIAAGDPLAVWTVDSWGGARRSTNGGTAWAAAADPAATACNGVGAVSASEAWAACNSGILRRTVDGGASWQPAVALGTTQHLMDVSIAGTAIWVVGLNGTIRRSTDSGANFAQPAGAGFGAHYWSDNIEAVSASTAWVRGNGANTFRTTDGGATFQRVDPAGWTGGCDGLSAPTALIAWRACDAGHVDFTTDGGVTWTTRNLPVHRAMYEVAALDALRAIVVGDGGETWRTTDGGITWIRETGATANILRDVDIDAGGRVVAAAHGDQVMGSTDFGDTWNRFNASPDGNTFTDADAWDGNAAVLVGGYGQVATTANGGVSATTRNSGTTRHLRAVTYLTQTAVLAAGDDGAVVRSGDGGATWSVLGTPTSEDILDLARSDRGTVLAVGSRGTILRSSDDGTSWTQVRQSGTTKLDKVSAVAWVGEQVAWAVGDNELVLRSTDGGRTWSDVAVPGADPWTPWLAMAVSADGQRIYLHGFWGTVFRSLDGGTTWASVPGAVSLGRGQQLEYHGSGVLTLTTEGQIVLGTDDLSTNLELSQTWTVLRAYASIDPTRSIGGGEGGRIVRILPNASVPDYGGGSTWATGSTTGMFGVCLQAVGGAALPDWTVDSTGTANRCEASDADPWRAVSTTASTAAHLTSAGTGSIDLVFGVVPAASQPRGTYRAKVAFEVVAPG